VTGQRRSGWGAVAGVLAAAVAVGVAEFVAALIRPESSPLLAVGGVMVDAAPRQVKDFAIRTFGTADKAALLVGIAVLLTAFAAGIGVLASRQPGRGIAGVCAFGAVGVAAVLSRPAPAVSDVIPTLLGVAAACLVLYRLTDLLPPRVATTPGPAATRAATSGTATAGTAASGTATAEGAAASGTADTGAEPAPAGRAPQWDRRRLLRTGAVTAAVAAAAGFGGRLLSQARFSARRSREAVRLPAPATPGPRLLASLEAGVPGASSFLTPSEDFYRVDTALIAPQVSAETWSLRIHGMVQREVVLSYADLLARPLIERVVTLACVSNEVGGEYVGTARWLGVPVREVLAQAGLDPRADQLVCRSADHMTIGAPTRFVTDGRDALLAVGMNGEPLPIEHGFPVRMVVPGLYGYCSACKWLVDIEATTFGSYDAYWVERGWAQVAEIRTESRIDTPRPFAQVRAGTVAVAGVAWAQHRGISAVQVSVDGGGWQPARLSDQFSADAWRLWTYRWQAQPGQHTLSVRATDGTGAVQTAAVADPFPSGATGYHTIQVTAG
jgi:DMSO/TMAO reductase YedYZ molybdopterin-dependent catalytic subunit